MAETRAESHAQAVELAKVRERLALVEPRHKTTIESERIRYQQGIEQLQADLLERNFGEEASCTVRSATCSGRRFRQTLLPPSATMMKRCVSIPSITVRWSTPVSCP